MKYCNNCGAQIADEAVVCIKCGCAIATAKAESSGLQTAAKIFMILGCVASAFAFLFPLLWTIPMTVHYFNATKNRQPVGTGFKVCSLLFVNIIAGILMLCDDN